METGLFLGVMAYISTMMLWWNSPNFLKRWTLHHPVPTDFFVAVLTHYTMSYMSKSIASMVAASVVGILMQITLTAFERPRVKAYLGLEDPPSIPLRERMRLPRNPFTRKA